MENQIIGPILPLSNPLNLLAGKKILSDNLISSPFKELEAFKKIEKLEENNFNVKIY